MAQLNDEVILGIKVKYQDAIEGITALRNRIDELNEANKELRYGNEEQRKQYTKNKIAAQELGYEMRTLQKEVQNNVREQRSQEGSLKRLRAELSQATKRYDEMSRAERNSAKGVELKNHITAITKELKGAEAETERFYRNVGNYENALKNALGLNNSFATSLMNMASGGEGIKGMFAGMTQAAGAFGKALLALAANPVVLALAGVAGAVAGFKWFFNYNQGIAEATRLTREFFNIEGDALTSVRNSIQATADIMGKDYVEVLKTVDAIKAQWNDLSVEDALKVVNDGFVAGADLSGDMLSKLEQYAPTFHDAGIAADEMVAIIAQTRSGIFSDKGLEVISMASKRIREMSSATASSLDAIGISSKQVEEDLQSGAKSTFDIIQEVSERLKELPQNGQEVGQVLKDVFGRTAAEGGLQMIESLSEMSTKIDEVKEKTGEYGRLQEEQIEAQKELNMAVGALFDMSDNGWENMMMNAKIWLTKFLTKIIKGIIDIINYFIDLYNDSEEVRVSVQLLVGAFKSLWYVGKLVFGSLIDIVKALGKALVGVSELLMGLISMDFDKMEKGAKRVSGGFETMFKDISGNIEAFAKNEVEIAKGFWGNINKKVDKIQYPTAVDSGTGGGGDLSTTTTTTKTTPRGTTGGSGGTGKSAAKTQADAAKAQADRLKDEIEQLDKLESLWNKLITDNFERQRAQINEQYDKQIKGIEAKIAEGESKHTKDSIRAMIGQINALNDLRQLALEQIKEQEMKSVIDMENKRISYMLQAIKKGSEQEEALRAQQLDNEHALEAQNIKATITDEATKNEMLLALDAAYQQKRLDLAKQYREKEKQEMMLAAENDMTEKMMQADTELERLRLQLERAQQLRDEAHRKEEETDEQYRQRKLQLEQAYIDKKKALAEKERQIEQAKYNAVATMLGALSDILEEAGEDNRSLLIASKMLAIAEVGIQQGIAIANAIRAATEGSHTWWEAAAEIAAAVATVTTTMLGAMKSIKKTKFARGGLVLGAGTGTSDSIPARLSNGESVMNAQSTQMFAPLLSAINQLGGGVPIMMNGNTQGEDFLAAAVAKGMAYAPRPVVSVEEINRVSSRVEVVENMGRIR